MLRVEKGGLEMKKTWLLALVLLGIPALGQSSFDGTWRLEMQKAQFEGVHKMLLKDGVYDCATCDPPIQGFKADGQPHPTSGSPYYDTVVVRVLDDRTVEMSATKNGKLSGRAKETVSADGSTLTIHDSFTSEDGKENSMTEVWKRTGEAPAGANKISGTWQQEKIEGASRSLTTITYKATPDGLTMRDGTGDSYDAKFDGNEYPYKGDPGVTSVSLKKIDANTVEETDKRNGKVVSVARMTVEPGGKTMKITIQDKVNNTAESMIASKE